MIKTDVHVHTDFSPDSKTDVRDQIERAIELSVKSHGIMDIMEQK